MLATCTASASSAASSSSRARGSGWSKTLGGRERLAEQLGRRARRWPGRPRTPRAARGPPPHRSSRRRRAGCSRSRPPRRWRRGCTLAARDDRRRDPGAEDQQDRRVGAAEAAPAQLGDGGGLHVGAHRRARAVEAVAQQRGQLELLPARHVGGERDTVLVARCRGSPRTTATHRPPRSAAVAAISSSARATARSTACAAPRPASVSSRSDSSSRRRGVAVASAIFVPPKSMPRTKSRPDVVSGSFRHER